MPTMAAKARVDHERAAEILSSAGWWRSDDGWRHGRLNNGKWEWPMSQAAQLQREADEGRQEAVYRMLRGEET